jgi:transposase
MDPRQERGLAIAALANITRKGGVWLVPSQTGNGKKYTVCPDPENPHCTCPDHQELGIRCKHLYAVAFVQQREMGNDGTITETRSLTVTEKKTYRQDWPSYNLAQVEEKRRFQALLADLCNGVEEPPANKMGRKRTPMADMIFASVLKVYTTFSIRRFGTDLEQATAKGYVSHKLNPLMVSAFMKSELLTPVLEKLIRLSAAPLQAVETQFAVDSSGFSASRFVRWTDEKYGKQRSGRDWVKCHVCCGTKTHVITAVEIHDRDAADAPLFGPLVKATAETFKIGEVSADKAYLSAENVELTAACGGTPFIAFKVNSTGSAGGLFEKMFHYYSLNRDEFMAHYHRRSNAESVFSMVKAKFRDHVRSKETVSMKNEVLCKILCHNLCCLIMSQCELGIEPVFWKEETQDATTIEPEPLRPSVEPVELASEAPRREPVRHQVAFCVGA